MDPADPAHQQTIVARQADEIRDLEARVEALITALAQRSSPPRSPSSSAVPMSQPDKYDGTPGRCLVFLRQLEIYFSSLTHTFTQDSSRCAFMLSLLSGDALDWAAAVWDTDREVRQDFQYFTQLLQDVFHYPSMGRDPATQLLQLQQGGCPAAEHTIRFCTLAAQSGFNDLALRSIFQASLDPGLQKEIVTKGVNLDFARLAALTVKVDNLIRAQPKPLTGAVARFRSLPTLVASPRDTGEPMQVGGARVSPEERLRRQQEQLCYYCGRASHGCARCPVKKSTSRRKAS